MPAQRARRRLAWRTPSSWLAAAVAVSLPGSAAADELATALYVRSDSDHTTVVSPRARAQRQLDETTEVDATYAADVWTSASIDIRTSASKRPVTEQRDELDVGVTRAFEDVSLHVGYRLSIENDYDSNGLSASASWDFADNAANLTLSVNGIHDVVGHSGDPDFARRLDTLDTRLSFTQVLDPNMFATLTYELAVVDGYQASPYRYVGFGGTGAGCVDAGRCLPEDMPDARLRHALAATLRRAFGGAFSAGATYRFYFDDWGLQSHTGLIDLGLDAGEHTLLALHYRVYTQGRVDFYRERYPEWSPSIGHTTHDRELSTSASHRVGLDLEQTIGFEDGRELSMSIDVAGAQFYYYEFVGLESVHALEVTTALVLTL